MPPMERDRWLYSLSISALAASVAGLLVPLYIVRLGGDAAQLGISAALASLMGAPSAVLAGRYADRTGNRRGVVLVALAASAVALSILPVLTSVTLVIVLNGALAFALAAVGPVVTMLVVEDAPERSWNGRIARLNTFQGYGGTVGLVVGTVWTTVLGVAYPGSVVQKSLFALAAAFGAASALLAARWLPRRADLAVGPRRSDRVATLLARSSRTVREATFVPSVLRFFWSFKSLSGRSVASVRTDVPRSLWLYFVAAGSFFTGFGVFWAPLPLFLSNAGFASSAIFGIYLVNNVGSTVLFGAAGRFSDAHDLRLVQGTALGTRALGFLSVGLVGILGPTALRGGGVGPLVLVSGLLAVIGVTWAFIAVSGTAIVSRAAAAPSRGAILGLYAALAAVASALGNVVGGWLAGRSFALAFAASVVLVLVGAVVVVAARREADAGAGRSADAVRH